jgi:S-adenosylmethionine:tRNA ribosyltransferase-isomerase
LCQKVKDKTAVGCDCMNTRNTSVDAFDYVLPENKIAKFPLPRRDDSKLLVYSSNKISETVFASIAECIPANSLLIFNDTKVIAARIKFKKESGGIIEVFCLEPDERYADINSGMLQTKSVFWKCLIGGASKWKDGQIITKQIIAGEEKISLSASIAGKSSGSFIVHLSWTPVHFSFAEVVQKAGTIPLPPYIKREVIVEDEQRYQTVYAVHNGSVAAPTAGLHFTENIFKTLDKKNIHHKFITLHVGAGTFKPVKSATLATHEMHAEFIKVHIDTLHSVIANLGKNIFAVGTTSLRTLESLYWLGVKTIREPAIEHARLFVDQWDAYDLETSGISPTSALQSLLTWMQENRLEWLVSKTQLLIAPSYQFKIVNGLVTNFHQPRSTLLLLIAAFIGKEWKRVYSFALEHDFRFLSYGDSCLLFREGS